MLTKKDLKHLIELTRLELDEKNQDQSFEDLKKILDYFDELKELNTNEVEPLTGGTFQKNIFRSDDSEETNLSRRRGFEMFPDQKNGFVKIPPVFEE